MQLPMKMRKNVGKEHSVRSLGKHSKICTSKGSRDRRIRLSANTAIQFYDVQDRLGFDRPSNAIDWLMKEAKSAIDVLNADQYHHIQELLLPDTASCVFNLSEAFHRTPGDPGQQNMVQGQISGFNKSQFEIFSSRNRDGNLMPIGEDADVIFRHLSWNPNYNESEGFEFMSREPLQSSFQPPVGDSAPNNESYGLLGVSFEQEIQVQEAVRIWGSP